MCISCEWQAETEKKHLIWKDLACRMKVRSMLSNSLNHVHCLFSKVSSLNVGSTWREGLGISEGTLWSEGLVKQIFVPFFLLFISSHVSSYNGLMLVSDDILFGCYQDISKDSYWEIDHVAYRRRTILVYIWKIGGI